MANVLKSYSYHTAANHRQQGNVFTIFNQILNDPLLTNIIIYLTPDTIVNLFKCIECAVKLVFVFCVNDGTYYISHLACIYTSEVKKEEKKKKG